MTLKIIIPPLRKSSGVRHNMFGPDEEVPVRKLTARPVISSDHQPFGPTMPQMYHGTL